MNEPPVVRRAHEEISAGRLWKARDRLQGALANDPANQEILGLLGDVLYRMGDRPQAGRAWFLTDRTGPDAEAALDAFNERYGWRSAEIAHVLNVRAPVDSYPPAVRDRLASLHIDLRSRGVEWSPHQRPEPRRGDRPFAAVVGTLTIGLVLVCLLIGAISVVRWVASMVG